MSTAVYASFKSGAMAERAIGALLDHGVSASDVGVAVNEAYDVTREFITAGEIISHADSGITVTTAEDASSGAVKGAGFGLAIGTLAAVASVALPGFGLILGGGAWAAAAAGLVGTTAAGAIAGGVMGYLKDQGLPEATVEHYDGVINMGGAVVSVTVPSNGVDWHTVEGLLAKYDGRAIHHLAPTAPPLMSLEPDEDKVLVENRSR